MFIRTALFTVISSLATAAWAGSASLLVLRVEQPASVTHEGITQPLAPSQVIAEGNLLSTGPEGKVLLQLAGRGRLVLSSFGELQVHDMSPDQAKLALRGGAVRVNSRAVQGAAAQDVRLNVGRLKARLLGTDAWAAHTVEGDTLCLLAGRADIQVDGAEEQRLSESGSCLRHTQAGVIERFSIDGEALIVAAVAATAFVDDERATSAQPAAPLQPEKAPSASAAASVVTDTAVQSAWTFVVLSDPRPDPITVRVQALIEQGLPASARRATVKGRDVHRATIGRFATHSEANAYASRTLTPLGIRGWAAPL